MELLELEDILQLNDRSTGYIYFLILEGKIVYVGKTTSIGLRMVNHRNHKKVPFDTMKFIEVPLEDINEYELRYIRKFRPHYNNKYNKDRQLKKVVKSRKRKGKVYPIVVPKAVSKFSKVEVVQLNENNLEYYLSK